MCGWGKRPATCVAHSGRAVLPRQPIPVSLTCFTTLLALLESPVRRDPNSTARFLARRGPHRCSDSSSSSMHDLTGTGAGWGAPSPPASTGSAALGCLTDLEGLSWFPSPSEADLAPLLQPMAPEGGALPLLPPLVADLLFDQPQGAAQQEWLPPIVQPQLQQMDLSQPAPQPPARSGARAASAADANEARRVRNRAGEQPINQPINQSINQY